MKNSVVYNSVVYNSVVTFVIVGDLKIGTYMTSSFVETNYVFKRTDIFSPISNLNDRPVVDHIYSQS